MAAPTQPPFSEEGRRAVIREARERLGADARLDAINSVRRCEGRSPLQLPDEPEGTKLNPDVEPSDAAAGVTWRGLRRVKSSISSEEILAELRDDR